MGIWLSNHLELEDWWKSLKKLGNVNRKERKIPKENQELLVVWILICHNNFQPMALRRFQELPEVRRVVKR